jgi:1,4-dihydroxy-2-naphthoate octaprenyltransferase
MVTSRAVADRGLLHRVASAARLKTAPLSIGSVVVVAADAFGRDLSPDPLRIAACGGIAIALHITAILVSDLFDHRAGTDKLARLDRNAIATGSLLLEAGRLTGRQVARAALAGLAIAAAIVASLGDVSLWIWFAAALACLWSYAAPPLRLAYVGAGFGELLIAAAYGPLLAAATARALEMPLSLDAWLGSCAVGVLVSMAFGSHHFLHWRADRSASKRTPVVAFGEEGALVFIGSLDLAAFATILVSVVVGALPPYAAIALVGAPGIAVAIRAAALDPVPQRILGLIGAHLAAVVLATAGLTIGLLLA